MSRTLWIGQLIASGLIAVSELFATKQLTRRQISVLVVQSIAVPLLFMFLVGYNQYLLMFVPTAVWLVGSYLISVGFRHNLMIYGLNLISGYLLIPKKQPEDDSHVIRDDSDDDTSEHKQASILIGNAKSKATLIPYPDEKEDFKEYQRKHTPNHLWWYFVSLDNNRVLPCNNYGNFKAFVSPNGRLIANKWECMYNKFLTVIVHCDEDPLEEYQVPNPLYPTNQTDNIFEDFKVTVKKTLKYYQPEFITIHAKVNTSFAKDNDSLIEILRAYRFWKETTQEWSEVYPLVIKTSTPYSKARKIAYNTNTYEVKIHETNQETEFENPFLNNRAFVKDKNTARFSDYVKKRTPETPYWSVYTENRSSTSNDNIDTLAKLFNAISRIAYDTNIAGRISWIKANKFPFVGNPWIYVKYGDQFLKVENPLLPHKQKSILFHSPTVFARSLSEKIVDTNEYQVLHPETNKELKDMEGLIDGIRKCNAKNPLQIITMPK